MKNKKLAISVLSTAVLVSMASAAFAQPKEGLYIGGNLKKYYSSLALADMAQDDRNEVVQNINDVGNDNVVYVDGQGKAASVTDIVAAGNLRDALRDPDENTFAEGDYDVIGSDGEPTGETTNPGSEIDPGEPGELVVESVSAIANNDETVTISGKVSGGAESVSIVVDTAAAVSVTPDANGNFTYTTSVLSAAAHTYSVTAVKGTTTSEAKTGSVTVTAVAPTVTSVTAIDSTHVKVVFSEPVSKSLAENITNYTITDPTGVAIAAGTVALTTNSTASLSADGKTVTITLGNTDVPNGLVNATYYLTINDGTTTPANSDITDLAGNKLGKSIVSFQGVATADTTAPTVQSAAYNSAAGTVVVNFSEAIKTSTLDKTKFSITDGTTTVNLTVSETAMWSNGNRTVTFALSSSIKAAVANLGPNKSLTVAAGAVKDNGNNDVVAVSGLSLDATTVLTSATYDEATNILTLNFNKDVDVTTIVPTEFTLDGSSTRGLLATDSVLTTTNGKEVKIKVNKDANLDAFEGANVTGRNVDFTAASGGFKDVSGNAVSASGNVALTYTEDTAAPTLVSAKYNRTTNRLTLEFSEEVQVDNAADVIQVSDTGIHVTGLVDNTGTAQAADTIDNGALEQYTANGVANSAKVLTFNAASIANTANRFLTADSKLYFDKGAVKDDAGNELAEVSSANAVSVEYTDATPPTVTFAATQVSPNQVLVSFSEKVDKATAENVANYTIKKDDNPGIGLTVTKAVLNAAGTGVYLTTAENAVNGYTYEIKVNNVKDLFGNVVSTIDGDANGFADNIAHWMATTTTDTTGPSLNATGATYKDVNSNYQVDAGDTITLQFNEPLVLNGTLGSSDFTVTGAADFATKGFGSGATYALGTSADTLVITLGSNPGIATSELGTAQINSKVTTKIKDAAGNSATVGTASTINKPDTTRPTITEAKFVDAANDGKIGAGDTVTLTFSEALDTTQSLATLTSAAFTFAGPGNDTFGTLTASSAEYADNKTIKITLPADADLNGVVGTTDQKLATTTVVNINPAQNVIKDLWGNNANAGTNVQIKSDDATRPSLVSAKITAAGAALAVGDKLEITLSENVALANTPTFADFVLYVGSTGYALNGVNSNIAVSGNKVTITLAADATNWVGKNVADLTTFNLAGTGSIYDAAGNSVRIASGFGVSIQ